MSKEFIYKISLSAAAIVLLGAGCLSNKSNRQSTTGPINSVAKSTAAPREYDASDISAVVNDNGVMRLKLNNGQMKPMMNAVMTAPGTKIFVSGQMMRDNGETDYLKPGQMMMMDGTRRAADSGDLIEPAVAISANSGDYQAYSPDRLSLAADGGKVVIFFRAIWCPTCKILDESIRSNKNQIPAGIHILDADYDKESALKRKYGVTYQHTLVQVDSSGKMLKKWSGGSELDDILGQIE